MNNAYLIRESQVTALKNAVKAKFPVTYQSKTYPTWNDWVNFTREDFKPIRVRDDVTGKRFILQIEIKDNPSFAKLKEVIQAAGVGVSAVQILKKDLPEYSLDGATDYSIPL